MRKTVKERQDHVSVEDQPLARFGMGNVFHLLRGDIELPCKDFPVALRLIEHEDKIAVLKDILNFAAAQKVFDILRDGGWDPAPFTKTLPNLHGIGGGLFLFEEQMKLVHVVAGGFLFSPVYGYSVPHLILHNEHPQLFKLLSKLLDVKADKAV